MTARKPRALVLCFFPAFSPPSSGGEMRLGGLYRELSRHYDITLLTSTDYGARFEDIQHSPDFRELRFPKDDHWRKAQATLLEAGVVGDLWGLMFALAVSDPACALRRAACELAEGVDVILHEFPFSEPIFAEGAPAPEVYNAHNVEASLLSSIVAGPGFETVWLKLLRMEGNLVRRARTFAASEGDAEVFRLLYGATNVLACPNGYAEAEIGAIAAAREASPREAGARLLFTGSAHMPNVDAAENILVLARHLPDCRFVLAGGVCAAIAHKPRPDNVELFGFFTPAQKKELLGDADLYINPVVRGSGSSLKAVEALAAGVPMVSTPEGVRGLGLTPDEHAVIVQREDFVLAIRRALADGALRARIAAQGRELARARFGWGAIADQLAADLRRDAAAAPAAARPMVLAFNDYPVAGAPSGGAARIANLLGALGCDVVLLTFAEHAQIGLLDQGVLHVGVPKHAEHAAFEAEVNRDQSVSVNDGVAALFVAANRALREIAAALAHSAQAFIFEHPYMAPALEDLRRLRPDAPVVYSAHNVEAELKRKLLRGHPLARTLVGFIAELERRLVAQADLIVCCTPGDRAHFAKMSSVPIVVAGNGCRIGPFERAGRAPGLFGRVGFLGSSHGPNVEAADYIVRTLAPAFPQLRFELIGSVCSALKATAPNVVLHGVAPERVKNVVMSQWDLALNPVTVGGGSSLKLPDYMAQGLPTLNTPQGARGFAVAERGAGRVVELLEFPRALAQMFSDPAALLAQGGRARAYAEQDLSWAAIAQAFRAALQPLLRAPAPPPGKKLLVVTYRYTEPSLGGAEEYLVEVAKRLRGRFARIDLAAVDVERIENRHHFGCALTAGPGAAGRIGEIFDGARYFPNEELDEAELRSRAQDLERVWAQEEFHLLAPFAKSLGDAQAPRLLSGFYGTEYLDGRARRWTAPDFSVLIPREARFFHLRGVATVEKNLSLILVQAPRDGSPIISLNCEARLSDHFDVHFALPEAPDDCVRILLCRADEHETPPDHRPFGVMVEAAAVSCAGAEDFSALRTHAADLAFQPEDVLREDFEGWAAALRQAALRREPDADAAFSAMRGPHAPAMQDWLAAHGGGYDCVLVQGVPFDVVPSSVATLAGLSKRPRIVALPHFHGDDRFYHWRSYYDAFASADRTLLFSDSLARMLGDAEKCAVVPGGGVSFGDLGGPGVGRAFREVCPVQNPFYLVLGRKTGSKGYFDVIEAHLKLRARRSDIDLVMIGPDDDGFAVAAPGLHVLGRQSREIVRGALAACLGLISMSRSESFGIVLCEAWLFGKPVIANARCAAFRDLVRPEETGILAAGVEELAGAMARLADDPEARRRMGRAGFVEVVAKYSWDKCADAIAATLGAGDSD
ncbi:glycosyltransferase involved in cell wall biosynthesis [Rhodoblastus acidophilus]|uniref:glycosyltransferase n=1 Tax=Rhodoblastus acidophilus TaxID=1074 RepID=UPI002227CF30|nr:glycosyltransferase [Rhodoblastus acidophilus]MCW2285763.1 glycosyltransferase involved in cell wall biosynthesis [Rhodoblastus acidophilus]MCW2333414.1 glycosyltransferase involved in cell wall biosynthesis [Rhodoblastus acidophilus]